MCRDMLPFSRAVVKQRVNDGAMCKDKCNSLNSLNINQRRSLQGSFNSRASGLVDQRDLIYNCALGDCNERIIATAKAQLQMSQ